MVAKPYLETKSESKICSWPDYSFTFYLIVNNKADALIREM